MQTKVSKAGKAAPVNSKIGNDEDVFNNKIGYYISVVGIVVVIGVSLYFSLTNKEVVKKNYSNNIQDETENGAWGILLRCLPNIKLLTIDDK